jgi:hypothetical protein
MTTNLVAAQNEGTWDEQVPHRHRSAELVDDVGLLGMSNRNAAAAFFQVVKIRYEKGHSTTVSTNRSLPNWGDIFGHTVVAAGILDRAHAELRRVQHSAASHGASENTMASSRYHPTSLPLPSPGSAPITRREIRRSQNATSADRSQPAGLLDLGVLHQTQGG